MLYFLYLQCHYNRTVIACSCFNRRPCITSTCVHCKPFAMIRNICAKESTIHMSFCEQNYVRNTGKLCYFTILMLKNEDLTLYYYNYSHTPDNCKLHFSSGCKWQMQLVYVIHTNCTLVFFHFLTVLFKNKTLLCSIFILSLVIHNTLKANNK